uniref:Protein naked cuticle homolog n=1 Tax=Glossina pallidipes TaxID=7398 RepID=A0A1A9ZUB2_GLOPL
MAGSIVKWWKHKILGGYKQISVQECTTDSEDLMFHHVRASSSCSAPPDLLLVGERENNLSLLSPAVNIIGNTSTIVSPSSMPTAEAQNYLKQHQQLQYTLDGERDVTAKCLKSGNNSCVDKHNIAKQNAQHRQQAIEADGLSEQTQQVYSLNTSHMHHAYNHQNSDERIRLEEFTCDVSVEGDKSSQPLQFSFTFYDLDGHHGKITKDDIVGIVYTIYESIGKSVVVPHCGSKTFNVRLTVSPEGKPKSSKAKKIPSTVPKLEHNSMSAIRRHHRYRARKLIRSDDEDDDSNSDKECETSHVKNHTIVKPTSRHVRNGKVKLNINNENPLKPSSFNNFYSDPLPVSHDNSCSSSKNIQSCRDCSTAGDVVANDINSSVTQGDQKSQTTEAFLKHVESSRTKLLRKSRKQKEECTGMRPRSLSVGNETLVKDQHLQKKSHQRMELCPERSLNGADAVDSVQRRNPQKSPVETLNGSSKRNSAECWKTTFNRNDLISIIRESMEKNRLCFQLNGKPQANVDPITQPRMLQHMTQSKQKEQAQLKSRLRSNTMSKIPTLIANHNNSHSTHTQSSHHIRSRYAIHNTSIHERLQSSNIYHPHPHVPIYQQQMIVNHPAILSSQSSVNPLIAGRHSKINLCGYDSFLHATICGGNVSHSPQTSSCIKSTSPNNHHQQPIATVQPIISTVPNRQSTPKHFSAIPPNSSNRDKSGKILRTGLHNKIHQTAIVTAKNSPQYHGYQRLSSTTKHNLAALNLLSPTMEKPPPENLEKWRKEQMKNYDQMLYDKLREKLRQTNLTEGQRRTLKQKRANNVTHQADHAVCDSKIINDYSTMVPIMDPLECENLISQTSDEEGQSQNELTITKEKTNNIKDSAINRNVVEGTLVDLDDDDDITNFPKYQVGSTTLNEESGRTNELGLDDEEEMDEEEEEEEDDEEEINDLENDNSSSNKPGAATIVTSNDPSLNNNTSSLVHRYVHEHIHHHYHHFEEKE